MPRLSTVLHCWWSSHILPSGLKFDSLTLSLLLLKSCCAVPCFHTGCHSLPSLIMKNQVTKDVRKLENEEPNEEQLAYFPESRRHQLFLKLRPQVDCFLSTGDLPWQLRSRTQRAVTSAALVSCLSLPTAQTLVSVFLSSVSGQWTCMKLCQ